MVLFSAGLATASILESQAEMWREERRQAAAAAGGGLRKASSSWLPHPGQEEERAQGSPEASPGEGREQPALPGRQGQEGFCLPEVACWRTGVNTRLTKGELGKSQGFPWLMEALCASRDNTTPIWESCNKEPQSLAGLKPHPNTTLMAARTFKEKHNTMKQNIFRLSEVLHADQKNSVTSLKSKGSQHCKLTKRTVYHHQLLAVIKGGGKSGLPDTTAFPRCPVRNYILMTWL